MFFRNCAQAFRSYGGFRRNGRRGQEAGGDGRSKKEFEEGVEMIMPLELIDFITPLYDFYDTDEEEVEEGNKNGV